MGHLLRWGKIKGAGILCRRDEVGDDHPGKYLSGFTMDTKGCLANIFEVMFIMF